jgi:hypothetical protein
LGGLAGQKASRLKPHAHFGDLVTDGLVFDYWHTHAVPLPGVIQRFVQAALDQPDAISGDHWPGTIKNFHSPVKLRTGLS